MAYIHISYEEKDNDEGGDAVEVPLEAECTEVPHFEIQSKYEYADV